MAQNTILAATDIDESFITAWEDFLLLLRDDYGFAIPSDRLKTCLACAEDIRDVEEICYRTQSLICQSKEQIESFQSLFAQRFLMMETIEDAEKRKQEQEKKDKKKEKNEPPKPTLEELELQAEQAQKRIMQAQGKIIETEQQRSQAADKISVLEEKARERAKDLQQAEAAKEEAESRLAQAAKAMVPNQEDPKLAKAIEDVMEAFRKTIKEELLSKQLSAALQSPEYAKRLSELRAKIMDEAKKARNAKKMQEFSALLNATKAVDVLTKAASASIDREIKQEAEEAKKEKRAKAGELKTAQKEHSAQKQELNALKDIHRNLEQSLKSSKNAMKSEEKRMTSLKAQAEKMKEEKRREELWQQMLRQGETRSAGNELLIKESAKVHREMFTDGVRAVQTTAEVAELMQTKLERMSTEEKNKILAYIRRNARMFRQTLRKKDTSIDHRRVDVRRTVKAASRTNGEPFLIRYKEPKKSHAKVMILTDISGSCKNASQLALYFMAMMDQAFPGGCRKFAFVRNLNSVDMYFRDKSADEGVQAVWDNVPTRGVYSNYGNTIAEFKEEYGGTVHKDTTVIFVGDARNNKNESHADDLKYIADRCHKVYWLETDDPEKWDQGDSVISQYREAGAKVYSVRTVGDLLSFLGSLKTE